MPIDAMVIIILVGFFSIYVFYLIGVYIKLENRRSLILSKFIEIDTQIGNKLDLAKELTDLYEDKKLNKVRTDLFNSVSVNDKIKFNKKLDKLIDEIETTSRKIKKNIKSIKEINEKIDYSKEFYNDSLVEFNHILSTRSGKILAKIFKYSKYNTF